ncbi:type IV secretory system conjugative DNA transfer family protein [Paracoccus sp. CPCC 101403]|uniref:Type IV secretory system conjugative DNA transfer family protein n=1 Tax=Paracoccus broussonetiae TaxID=3075834 RepID=A0ABU3EKE5_9RHOB|nr:type IV secretory system conjugative DNA transfer family protein [Paracoccus sp. CPCC 101403]MDT1064698.1 type IV secretory system conjugative DNA transfer family protein [Paracoccus sp. CPCC 101403]
MTRFLVALPFGLICGALLGSVLGGMWLAWHLGQDVNAANPFLLLTGYPGWRTAQTEPWCFAYGVVIASSLALGLAALVLSFRHKLTQYGQAHFQSRAEMRRNGLLMPVGAGLVYGKLYRFGRLGRRLGPGRFISAVYDKFPHCLVVAPTRAGKGVGYVNPNVLLFPGSVVVLDVKGEIFEATARHRLSLGDEVFRFAPFDFEHSSHRYNPLERVAKIAHPAERYTELAKIADYFLTVSDKGNAGDFLSEGRQLFVAAGLLAVERGNPTIGEINRILFGQGASQAAYAAHALEVKHANAAETFRKFAAYDGKILSSHASVLGGAGMALWNNPAVDYATSGHDFSFADLRRRPVSVYLVVNSDSIQTLAPLIRLFFGELIATLRASMPDPQREPWPVKMILDEFDQLGRMTIVVQALKQLAGHGARVSIITQSVPGLEKIYGKEDRLSIESAAGMKLYLAANDKMTAQEISESLGKTTRLSLSDSYAPDRSGLLRRTISRRNEERPLLSPDEISRLDRNKVILIPERQQPIMARRIVYYEDPFFRKIMAAQTGPLPYPTKEQREIRVLSDQLHALASQVTELSKIRLIDYATGDGGNAASGEESSASSGPNSLAPETSPSPGPAADAQKAAIADALADLQQAAPEVGTKVDNQAGVTVAEGKGFAALRPNEAAAREKMARMSARIAAK